MLRLLSLLAAPLVVPFVGAAPAVAQQTGSCVQGATWWSQGALAGYGPCQSPEEGFLLLSCRSDAIWLDVDMPVRPGVEEGDAESITLRVDGQDFTLKGDVTKFPRTGNLGLGWVDLDATVLEALASGKLATLVTPSGGREMHLTGSRAATRALIQACGG